MTNQHPITPPQDKFDQWEDNILNERENVDFVLDCVWKDGFQTGADQELEACCAEVEQMFCWGSSRDLRTIRRPKPPSLKEQALEELDELLAAVKQLGIFNPPKNIRRALEALPND